MLTPAAPLFAADTETSFAVTITQLIAWGIPVVGGVGTAIGWAYRHGTRVGRDRYAALLKRIDHLESALSQSEAYNRQLQADIESRDQGIAHLRDDVKGRDGKLEQSAADLSAVRDKYEAMKQKLVPYYREYEKLLPKYQHAVETAKKFQAECGDLRAGLATARADLERRGKTLDRGDRMMRRAHRLKGQLWEAKALQGRPKFRPLSERKHAIVSVLNLKGGVGKTTLTAHVGRAFARRGYRVLVVDLDLQGSLTSLFLEHDRIKEAADGKRLVQSYFERASGDKATTLAGYPIEVLPPAPAGGCLDVVGATDELAYAELNLSMRWLLRHGDRDSRFLLRRALHRWARRYDLVLLDCPPLLNISCVNALAASDYLLVPVMPSQKAAERVPILLDRIKAERFRQYINHDLKVLGVVANRVRNGTLAGSESTVWTQLGLRCKEVYGLPVRMCETVVPLTKEVQDCENLSSAAPDGGDRLSGVFDRLADELERGLPNECRRAPAIPA
jgi:cellulose biosynthesis protein BcsQ